MCRKRCPTSRRGKMRCCWCGRTEAIASGYCTHPKALPELGALPPQTWQCGVRPLAILRSPFTSVLTIVVITTTMGAVTKRQLQSTREQRRAPCPEETAFLDLVRTCDLLSRGPAQVLKTEDLSATQYNVLRILRGTREGLPCGAIGR